MKRAALALFLCGLMISADGLGAQEKAKSEAADKKTEEKTPTALRVQIVFSEYDGDKKVSSLPYTLPINADLGPRASIRMGLRVPIVTGSAVTGNGTQNQYQYIDVGTNLDGHASKTSDGRFILHLSLERSSAYSSKETAQKAGSNEMSNTPPVMQQFKTELDLLIRDGQTLQSTMATDPVSGRVTKVDVTVNVVK